MIRYLTTTQLDHVHDLEAWLKMHFDTVRREYEQQTGRPAAIIKIQAMAYLPGTEPKSPGCTINHEGPCNVACSYP